MIMPKEHPLANTEPSAQVSEFNDASLAETRAALIDLVSDDSICRQIEAGVHISQIVRRAEELLDREGVLLRSEPNLKSSALEVDPDKAVFAAECDHVARLVDGLVPNRHSKNIFNTMYLNFMAYCRLLPVIVS